MSCLKNILQQEKPFDSEKPKGLLNIVISSTLDCISLDKPARDKFYEFHRKEKSSQLFGIIPKSENENKRATAQIKYNVNKVTVKLLAHVGYPCLPQIFLQLCMESNITPIFFCLPKDGLI